MKNPRIRSALSSTESHVKSALVLVSEELSSAKFDGRSSGTEDDHKFTTDSATHTSRMRHTAPTSRLADYTANAS